MTYKEIYMELMKKNKQQLSEEAIRNLATFLDNQNYYEFTKQINEQKIEEVTQINEEITIDTIKVNEEKVVELNKDVAFENLSDIILDLKPIELKEKFLDVNVDKKELYNNLETLNKIVPEKFELKGVLTEIKNELDIKPINNIQSNKTYEDYYYNLKNNEFNFSKPNVTFDTSFLGIKEYPNYKDIDLNNIDLSKPKSININLNIEPKIEIKESSIPLSNSNENIKVMIKEPIIEFVDRNFQNIKDDKLTLSGYNQKILDFEDLKNDSKNQNEKELYELLQVTSFSKMIESIEEYNKYYEYNIINKIQQDIQNNTLYQNQKEIERKLEEEKHKDDNKVKESSVLGSLGLMGFLLDNLNATYITKEEHDLQVKRHNQMLEEKDNSLKKFEENLDVKKDLDKEKEKSNYYYAALSSIYAFKSMNIKANLMVMDKAIEDIQDNIKNGKFEDEENFEKQTANISSIFGLIQNFESSFSSEDLNFFNEQKKEFDKLVAEGKSLNDLTHSLSGKFIDSIASNPKLLNEMLSTNENTMIINNLLSSRVDAVLLQTQKSTSYLNQLQEKLNDNNLTEKEKEETQLEINRIRNQLNKYKEVDEILEQSNQRIEDINNDPTLGKEKLISIQNFVKNNIETVSLLEDCEKTDKNLDKLSEAMSKNSGKIINEDFINKEDDINEFNM